MCAFQKREGYWSKVTQKHGERFQNYSERLPERYIERRQCQRPGAKARWCAKGCQIEVSDTRRYSNISMRFAARLEAALKFRNIREHKRMNSSTMPLSKALQKPDKSGGKLLAVLPSNYVFTSYFIVKNPPPPIPSKANACTIGHFSTRNMSNICRCPVEKHTYIIFRWSDSTISIFSINLVHQRRIILLLSWTSEFLQPLTVC